MSEYPEWMEVPTPEWPEFWVVGHTQYSDPPRSLGNRDGVGDRMRSAAFAEIQARDAFLWGAERWTDAPEELRQAWAMLAKAEQRHLDWLMIRMKELGFDPRERRVSSVLWHSLTSCKTAREFAHYMANAEERGRRAGVRFHQALQPTDPVTAEIFRKIAEEEVAHIALAERFFPSDEATPRSCVAPDPAGN